MKRFDLIVIGSGGGAKITRPAADLGKKVAIIEKDKLGGTCLNRGCIPSKMLIHAADVANTIRTSNLYSIDSKILQIHFKELVQYVSKTTDRESEQIAPSYDNHPNITYFRAEARFIQDKVLEVGKEQITADQIFIAVGAKPNIPKIEGLDKVPFMTYREALRSPIFPKKLAVIGGGYIATELGYFYGALGVETHFFVRSQLLRHTDRDIQEEFQKTFSKQFHVHLSCLPEKISFDGTTYLIEYQGKQLKVDALLVATGVHPDIEALRLENTAIQTTPKGFIQVNNQLETAVNGVHAFGDCIGNYLYRHSANFEGEYLFENRVKTNAENPIIYPPMPYAVFSHPQIGSVGKTEQQLEIEGVDYIVGLNRYADSAMGMALKSEFGFVKLLFERSSEKLIGAHIIGDEASNMIHMLIAYMNMNASLSDILNTIYIHPALPEIVRNAARKAKKMSK